MTYFKFTSKGIIVKELVNLNLKLYQCKKYLHQPKPKKTNLMSGGEKPGFLNLQYTALYMMQSPGKDMLELAILISSLNM